MQTSWASSSLLSQQRGFCPQTEVPSPRGSPHPWGRISHWFIYPATPCLWVPDTCTSLGSQFLLPVLPGAPALHRNEPDDVLLSFLLRPDRHIENWKEISGLRANKKLHNYVSTHHVGNVAPQGQKAAAWHAVNHLIVAAQSSLLSWHAESSGSCETVVEWDPGVLDKYVPCSNTDEQQLSWLWKVVAPGSAGGLLSETFLLP